jgi:hypothetical protein
MTLTPRFFALPACVALAVQTLGACAHAMQTPDVPERQRHVADVHRAKCGSCHVRVEPGTRTQAELETALARHRKRVHLTEEEWTQMIEYLSQPPQSPRG